MVVVRSDELRQDKEKSRCSSQTAASPLVEEGLVAALAPAAGRAGLGRIRFYCARMSEDGAGANNHPVPDPIPV